MNLPSITIITINRNNLIGLKQTIESVKKQTYQGIEYIIIDGNSNDGCKNLLQKEAAYITFSLSEKDSGIFEAMNKGVSLANGEYLLFLNSGDILTSPNVLTDFVLNSNFKGDILYGDYELNNGVKKYPDDLTPAYFMRSSLPHQSTLIHKRVFEKVGAYDESYSIVGDREHFLRAYLSDLFIFKHIPVSLARFDMNGVSNSSFYFEIREQENERLFKEHFGLHYPDYLELFLLRKELNKNKCYSLFKRVIRKLKRLF